MSFQLKVLGGASLEDAEGPLTGRATQRHRLALLALLGHAGARGLSREKLVGYLWPESTEERARRLLSDSVYRINKELGAEAVAATGSVLRLDADVLPSDLGTFRAALERQDWRAAVDAYGGPLLDGFHLPDAEEFERWLDIARAELARSHADALELLADHATANGELGEAANLWRRRAVADPYDARVAVRLMRALDAAGNRAGALRHARVHAELLDGEFGAGPDPEVEILAEELRAAPVAGAPPEPTTPRPAAEQPSSTPGGADSPPRGTLPLVPPRLAVAALVFVLAGTLAAVWMNGWVGGLADRPADVRSAQSAGTSDDDSSRIAIAVLPFEDLDPDEQGFFFSEGITEDVLTRLSGVDGFSVIARASVMPYRSSTKTIPAIAGELGVRYVVHGSVRHSATDVRITAQLVDARTNSNVWAQTYDRRLEDIFAVQGDIAVRVASALEARLSPRVAAEMDRPPTGDLEAYDAYLRGRFQWHLRTEAGLRRSVEFFEEAVFRDPAYARAWAGLADAYAVLAFYDYLSPSEAFPGARDAALRALGIDDRLPEAHASLGYITLYHDWDAEQAEASFRRSIELNPSYSTAHQWYANHLVATGRFEEAERAMNRARETNPLSLIANGALG